MTRAPVTETRDHNVQVDPLAIDRKALGTYLGDHLAGSVAAIDAMDRILSVNEHTSLGDEIAVLRDHVQHDQDIVRKLLRSIELSERPVAKSIAWIGEKVSRFKLGADSDEASGLALFESLETLTLGFHGRLALWNLLTEISDAMPLTFDFRALACAVKSQITTLERLRMDAGVRALTESAIRR